jgi:hypothetical protein
MRRNAARRPKGSDATPRGSATRVPDRKRSGFVVNSDSICLPLCQPRLPHYSLALHAVVARQFSKAHFQSQGFSWEIEVISIGNDFELILKDK